MPDKEHMSEIPGESRKKIIVAKEVWDCFLPLLMAKKIQSKGLIGTGPWDSLEMLSWLLQFAYRRARLRAESREVFLVKEMLNEADLSSINTVFQNENVSVSYRIG